MKVKANVDSYASGAYQFEETYDSISDAKDAFRKMINEGINGLVLTGDDAVMDIYSTDQAIHFSEYAIWRFSVGHKYYGKRTVKVERP